jgi:hypothetical protein
MHKNKHQHDLTINCPLLKAIGNCQAEGVKAEGVKVI